MKRSAGRGVVDVSLVVALAAVGVAEIWVPFPSVLGEGSRVLSTVLVVAMVIPLLWRRARPLLSATVVLISWPIVFTIEPVFVLFWGQFVPMVIAVFSVARYGQGRQPYLGAGVGAGSLLFFDLYVEVLQTPSEIVFHWMVFTVAWCFGAILRRFETRAHESTQRAIQVEVAAAEQAVAAVLDERTRIARELHDVIAHSVSVMVVQAGAAEQSVDDDPEFVRQALSTIRGTGTNALAEMRRVLSVFREGDDAAARAPQPGLDALPGLLDEVRSAGVEATVAVEGEVRPLPPGLDLAAYRIVQEALTNVRRHARAGNASVLLRYTRHDVQVEVTDDGVGAGSRGEHNGGHGLVGMRERVSLYGGELETGPAPGHGFTVRARLPVEPA